VTQKCRRKPSTLPARILAEITGCVNNWMGVYPGITES
jgi:hypothetical protein